MSLSTTTNTSGRTPEQDAVICALIGLARAAEAKELPAGTAPVLFAALSAVTPGDPLSTSLWNRSTSRNPLSPQTAPLAHPPAEGLRTFFRRT